MSAQYNVNIESTDDDLIIIQEDSQVVEFYYGSSEAHSDIIRADIVETHIMGAGEHVRSYSGPLIGIQRNTGGLVRSSFDTLAGIQADAGGVPLITAASRNLEMQTEIDQLRNRVTVLEEQIEKIEEASMENVIVLRSITREDAESEIMALFTAGETLYYSDISERLGIDLSMVVEICQELQERWEIGIDGDVV